MMDTAESQTCEQVKVYAWSHIELVLAFTTYCSSLKVTGCRFVGTDCDSEAVQVQSHQEWIHYCSHYALCNCRVPM